MDDIDDAAEDPFVASMDCGLAVVTPDIGSALFDGQGPVLCVFFRAAGVPHAPASPDDGMEPPLICDALCVSVVVEEPEEDDEEVDEIEEDEFARCALFRGMNIRATSSGFIEFKLCPPSAPHVGRVICW